MVNLEIELEKFRKTVKENSHLLDNRVYHRKMDILELIDVFLKRSGDKQGVDFRVIMLVSDCLKTHLINSEESPIYRHRTRPDDNIKIYNPQQTYTRLRRVGRDIKKGNESILRDLGFNGFNKDARNFVTKVYQIIYNAYLKETVEKERERRASISQLLSLRR